MAFKIFNHVTIFQAEVSEVLKSQRKKTPKKRRDETSFTSGSDSEFDPPKAKKKKQRLMPTTGKGLNPREKLYCVCRKPYDDSK